MANVQGLALTYDAPNPGDGSGAQIQRILAIYATSKSVNIGYIHSGIADLGPNPGDSFTNLKQRKEFLLRLNSIIEFPSDEIFETKFTISIKSLNNFTVRALPILRKLLGFLKITLVIKVQSVYRWIDRNTHYYESANKILRDRLPKVLNLEKKLVVDCHIRRAVVPEFLANGRDNPRYTKNIYFLNAIKIISEIANKENLEILIRIHTDIPSWSHGINKWEIPSNTSLETINYWATLGIVDDENLLIPKETFFDDLSEYGSIQILNEIDPIAAWQNMENADILISSKSSFSYVGGLLRGVKPVIFCSFWHSGLPTWLNIEESFMNDYTEFSKAIEYSCEKTLRRINKLQ